MCRINVPLKGKNLFYVTLAINGTGLVFSFECLPLERMPATEQTATTLWKFNKIYRLGIVQNSMFWIKLYTSVIILGMLIYI